MPTVPALRRRPCGWTPALAWKRLGAWGVVVMPSPDGLVGRDAELALAAAEVGRLGEGRRASVLAIEGEAGIGKTRLVQSIVDDARSRGMAVFCGRAHPFERTRPFGVVAAALGLSARSPDPRSAAIGALLAGQGAGASGAVGDIQYRVVEEIVDLVETACAERPVLLVAEDIHWADSASLLTILSIVRQLPLAPLLVVVTARPSPLPAEVVRLLDDLAAGGARTLRLQPLDAPTTSRLSRPTCSGRLLAPPDRHAGQGRREPAVGHRHAALAGRRRGAAP